MAMHRWRGYDHPTLHKMINSGPGPAASTPQTEYWDGLDAELAEIDADLTKQLGTLSATWEGGAADEARGGLTPLQAWAGDARTGASGMRASTEFQADMIARARAEVPEPVEVTTPAPSGWQVAGAGAAMLVGNPGPAALVAAQAVDHEVQEAKQAAASQKAVDAMDSYQSSSRFNTNTLGTFVPPPDVVIATPAPSGGVGYQVGTFATNFSGAGANTGTTAAAFAPSSAGGFGSGQFAGPTGGGSAGSFTPTTGTGAPTVPTGYVPTGGGTTPSGFTSTPGGAKGPSTFSPISAGAPTGTTGPGGGTPFTPGGFAGQTGGPGSGGANGVNPVQSLKTGTGANPLGAKGLTGGLGVGEDARRGGLGSSVGSSGGLGAGGDATRQGSQLGRGGVAGAGGFGSGENLMGGRNAGGAAAGGRGGVGGGTAGGRGARDEDDDEYETASYLVETGDVFGDDRTVSTPVLGGETTEQ